MKFFFKSILYFVVSILFFTFVFSLLSYFNILNYNKVIKLITLILSCFISSFYLGMHTLKKGWFSGLKFGLFFMVLSIIPTIILKDFKLSYLVFYTIIIFTSILSSCFGIMQKKEETT